MAYHRRMTPGELVRDARRRHGLTQQQLARRAGTTARHIGRIERDEISPTVRTLGRVLAAVGERAEITAVAGDTGNRSGAELQADYRGSTASERVAEGSYLSRIGTGIAANAREA